MPGWADFNGGDIFYGFPDLETRGLKFAHDQHGVEIDPDTQSRRPTDAALAEIIAYRDRRFPLLKGAQLTGAEVCQYENSSNGDFLIDVHPQLAERAAGRRRLGPRLQARPGSRALCGRAAIRVSEAGTAVQPRQQERDSPPRGPLVGLLRHPDQRRPQQPVLHHIAGLHFLDDRARLASSLGISIIAWWRCGSSGSPTDVDAGDAVALEHGVELARGGFDAGEELARASCRREARR